MTTLKFEDVWPTVPGDGWLAENEGRLLWDSALASLGPILEVGCYKGRSTCLLAALGRPLYCVDPFSNFDDADMSGLTIYQTFFRNVTDRGFTLAVTGAGDDTPAPPGVTLWRQKIEDWTPRPVGFAYLDGDHSRDGTASQLRAARAAGAPLACVHDYSNSAGGVLVVAGLADAGGRLLKLAGTMALVAL